jgi:SAM-dependent methyltransferase
MNAPRTRYSELREALTTIGFRRTCTVIGVRMTDAWFDWRNGLDTVRRVPLEALEIASDNKEHGTPYQPTGRAAFLALLRSVSLPRNVGFVDYGCGKGRVLLLAAGAGFRRVIGVEFSPQLAKIARANAARYWARHPGVAEIEVIEADASRYDPPADASIFYFYCPFDEGLMREAVERILRSLRDHPREAWLVYNLPRHRAAVDERRELALMAELTLGGYPCLVYRYLPRT